MMSLTGANGICTSQRRPALIVSVGVTRHESCTNSEYRPCCPARRRGPNATYLLVFASSAAWPVTDATRPVSSAYSSRASVSCAADAPGKFAVVNRPAAGSLVVLNPEVDAGHHLLRVLPRAAEERAPPSMRLCLPFCQFSVSSML